MVQRYLQRRYWNRKKFPDAGNRTVGNSGRVQDVKSVAFVRLERVRDGADRAFVRLKRAWEGGDRGFVNIRRRIRDG
ncbi:MAG TPA: hypothetical protein VHO70_22685 [Chitinispirillaceae bacterium]|nr:hypothetical protein [Chitinispirillaceae bacterium]